MRRLQLLTVVSMDGGDRDFHSGSLRLVSWEYYGDSYCFDLSTLLWQSYSFLTDNNNSTTIKSHAIICFNGTCIQYA